MKKIIVASTNPTKIEAVKLGFNSVFNEEFDIEGVSVSSNVSDQPMSSTETKTGANNRAENAFKERPDADFWVGLEGGVEDKEDGMMALVFICVKSKDMKTFGQPGSYYLPEKLAKLIRDGMELGHADDVVFNRSNSKQQEGSIGILSKGLYDRARYYKIGVEFALIPFINKDLYLSND